MQNINEHFSVIWLLNSISNGLMEPGKMMEDFLKDKESGKYDGLFVSGDRAELDFWLKDLKKTSEYLNESKKLIEKTLDAVSELEIKCGGNADG